MGRWLIWVWVWTALLLFWSSAMAQPLQDPLEPTSPSEEASQPELREGPIEEDTQPELSEGPIEEDTQPEPSEGPIEEPEPVEGPLEPGPIEGPIDEEPASGGPVDGADDPCVHTLRGKVLKPEGGSSVEVDDAAVYLRQVGGTASYQTVTDAQGRYTLEGVCPGVYEVEVLATGWDMVLNEYRIPEDGATADWKLSDSTTVIEVRANPYDVPSVRPQETLYGKELDKTRGLDLGEALTAIPGVRTIDMGTISKPVIHGMHSNRVLILFDGIKHEAQSWGLDHAPEIDPFAAHGLTVVKGAAGVRYGSGAIGGVILVHPPTIPRDPGLSGEAHLVGISNGLGGAGSLMLRGGVPQVEGLGWRVQGSIKRVGTLETPDYYLDNTGVEELNVSGAVGFHRSGYGLELSASRFDTTLGVFTGQVAENSNQFRELLERDRPLGEELYRFEYNIDRPYQEVTHTTYMGRGYFDVDVGRVSLQVAHQHNDRQEFDLVRSNVEGPQIDFDLRTLSGELLWEFDAAERWLGGVGLNASRQENIYKGRRLVPNYRTRAAGAFGWAQLLLDGWELEVGARLDSAYVESFQRERVGGDAADIEENQFTFITPSMVAGVLVEPDETWNISLTLSSASRAPTVNELFIDGVSQGLAALEEGDQGLSTEQTYGASLDLAWEPTGGWLSLHATGYGQFIDGYIYMAPQLDETGQPRVALTVNGGFPVFNWEQVDALFYGVDVDLRLEPASWLELRSTAALVRAWDVTRDDYLVFIPPDTYAQELRLKAASIGVFKDNYISVTSAYTARQHRFDPNADFTDPPDGVHLLHAGLGTALVGGDPDTRFQIALDVKNILDTRYRNYLSRLRYYADEPGRTAILRLKAAF